MAAAMRPSGEYLDAVTRCEAKDEAKDTGPASAGSAVAED